LLVRRRSPDRQHGMMPGAKRFFLIARDAAKAKESETQAVPGHSQAVAGDKSNRRFAAHWIACEDLQHVAAQRHFNIAGESSLRYPADTPVVGAADEANGDEGVAIHIGRNWATFVPFAVSGERDKPRNPKKSASKLPPPTSFLCYGKVIASLPFRVPMARQIAVSTSFATVRTEPSIKAAMTISVW
jgi:hypothetical protein